MKEAFYFSHDSNAKDDPKCMLLIEDLGLGGYGAFWVLIEYLREQPGYKCPLSMLKALARKYNATESIMNDVVKNYNLFIIDDDSFFYSESLINRMMPLEERRQKMSEAGKRGNSKRWNKASANDDLITTQSLPDSTPITTQSQVKKSKEEKSIVENNKEDIIFVPPTLEDIQAYIKKNNLNVSAGTLFEYYSGTQWKDKNGKPVKNWKLKAQTWSKQADSRGEHNRVEASNGVGLGVGEFLVDGKRCYGDRSHPVQIPDGMPPRPSIQYCLDRENLKWVIL